MIYPGSRRYLDSRWALVKFNRALTEKVQVWSILATPTLLLHPAACHFLNPSYTDTHCPLPNSYLSLQPSPTQQYSSHALHAPSAPLAAPSTCFHCLPYLSILSSYPPCTQHPLTCSPCLLPLPSLSVTTLPGPYLHDDSTCCPSLRSAQFCYPWSLLKPTMLRRPTFLKI